MFYTFYTTHYKKIINVLLGFFTLAIFILAFRSFYNVATPLIFGLIMFAIFEPFASYLHRKGVKKWLATLISTTSFLVVFIGFSVIFSAIVLSYIGDFSKNIPTYTASFESYLLTHADSLLQQVHLIPEDWVEKGMDSVTGIVENVTAFASLLLTYLVNTLSSSVRLVANLVIGFLFAVMLSIDAKEWSSFIHRYAPTPLMNSYRFLKENVVKGLSTYFYAQLKLISITFVVILIALLCLRVENAFTLAFIGGILDVLPLLGVSTLFVPWIIYLFMKGELFLAIALTVLLTVVLGTRQLLEPKITGDSLGVNASVMLAALILSTSILGIAGIFLSPILIILIKELIIQGHLARWFTISPFPQEQEDTK